MARPSLRQTALGLAILVAMALVGFYLRSAAPDFALVWVFGLVFGFLLQRGRFCFASAFRDLFLLRDGRVMKGILAGLAVATFGFALVMFVYSPSFSRVPAQAHVFPLGFHTLIAGVIFGVGMVVAGGCVSGNLYRSGEGYVTSWIAILGIMVGLSFVSATWNWWWRVSMANAPLVWLPQKLGWTGGVGLTLLALLGIFLLVQWWESRGGKVSPRPGDRPERTGFADNIKELGRILFRRPLPVVTAGTSLGLLNVFVYLYTHPLGVTGELWRWATVAAQKVGINYGTLQGMDAAAGCTPSAAGDTGLLSWGLLIDGGLIAGALIGALLANEFRLRYPRQLRRYFQSLGGGILLGYGAGLGLGCTIGAFFSAVPSLAVNGWVFGAGLALGALAGVQIIKRI